MKAYEFQISHFYWSLSSDIMAVKGLTMTSIYDIAQHTTQDIIKLIRCSKYTAGHYKMNMLQYSRAWYSIC